MLTKGYLNTTPQPCHMQDELIARLKLEGRFYNGNCDFLGFQVFGKQLGGATELRIKKAQTP